MALRARHQHSQAEQAPPLPDPVAVHHEFRRHRRKRLARIEHRREVGRARMRFWILAGSLFALAAFLSVIIWEQVQSMFGI